MSDATVERLPLEGGGRCGTIFLPFAKSRSPHRVGVLVLRDTNRASLYDFPMPNDRARTLRKSMTNAERKLWRALRGKQLVGQRFRRQHPLGPYVVDFVCLERRLVIEVDGGQHGEPEQADSDQRRTDWLAAEGYRVLRVWNRDVLVTLDDCMTTIWTALSAARPPQSTPT